MKKSLIKEEIKPKKELTNLLHKEKKLKKEKLLLYNLLNNKKQKLTL